MSRAGELRNKHVCATVQKVITKGRQAAEGSEAEEDREAMEVRMGACDEVAVRRWEITPTGQIKVPPPPPPICPPPRCPLLLVKKSSVFYGWAINRRGVKCRPLRRQYIGS